MTIRIEKPADFVAFSDSITAAFAAIQHSSQTEARIIDGLRTAGVLHGGLVAVD